ncbi:hypothetical protein SGPA1_21443 [Streptomyces misionensis JCM 4497]
MAARGRLGGRGGLDRLPGTGGRLAAGHRRPADHPQRVSAGDRPVLRHPGRAARLHPAHRQRFPGPLARPCRRSSPGRHAHLRAARPDRAAGRRLGRDVVRGRRRERMRGGAGRAACPGRRDAGAAGRALPGGGPRRGVAGHLRRRLLRGGGRLVRGPARRRPHPPLPLGGRRVGSAVRADLLSLVRPHALRAPRRGGPRPHPARAAAPPPAAAALPRRAGRRPGGVHARGLRLVGGLPPADGPLLPGRGRCAALRLLGVGRPGLCRADHRTGHGGGPVPCGRRAAAPPHRLPGPARGPRVRRPARAAARRPVRAEQGRDGAHLAALRPVAAARLRAAPPSPPLARRPGAARPAPQPPAADRLVMLAGAPPCGCRETHPVRIMGGGHPGRIDRQGRRPGKG